MTRNFSAARDFTDCQVLLPPSLSPKYYYMLLKFKLGQNLLFLAQTVGILQDLTK